MTPKDVTEFADLCEALTQIDHTTMEALSVLDRDTGKFLQHHQLRTNPKHKPTWDTSNANELGQLCQGIGTGPTPGTK
jgi:hypothetical protein